MSKYFPRALLAEVLGNQPRLIAAFEQFDAALEAAENKIEELETRATTVDETTGYQPRNPILDALSVLPAISGAIEQVSVGQFSVRPIDDPTDPASLISQTRGDTLYAPHP